MKARMQFWLVSIVCLVATLSMASVAYHAVGISIVLITIIGSHDILDFSLPRVLVCVGVELLTIGLALANLANIVCVVVVMVLGIIVMWTVLFVTVVEDTNIDTVSEDKQHCLEDGDPGLGC